MRSEHEPPRYIYLDRGAGPYTIGTELARGGEGSIFLLPDLPGKVLKYYHSPVCPELPQRLTAILRRGAPTTLDGILIACLPEALAWDRSGGFAGYMMAKLDTRLCLHDLWLDQDGYFRSITLKARFAIAHNLAEAVDHLHTHGLVIGDLTSKNVALRTDGTVVLCDLGGCTVTDPLTGKHFYGGVGTPSYLAPELFHQPLRQARFTQQSDCFSLAILIFQIISGGCHPFNTPYVHLDDQLSTALINDISLDILSGSPYVNDVPNRRIPPYALDRLPRLEALMPLFSLAFQYTPETATDPAVLARRPSARMWMDVLLQCWHNCQSNPQS